jgi:hypothetical protein
MPKPRKATPQGFQFKALPVLQLGYIANGWKIPVVLQREKIEQRISLRSACFTINR